MSYKIELKDPAFVQGINAGNFDDIALQVFAHQYEHNEIYHAFTKALGVDPSGVKNIEQIPFLPISFFKTHRVVSDTAEPAFVFESSGTTGETPSRHFVTDAVVYRESLLRGFKQFYGDPKDYVILALLPSYLERKNASLVHMAKVLMEESGHPDCGFYLDEWDKLASVLARLEAGGQKTLLLGVTFALLDFAEAHPMQLQHTVVMETGGMKGRREEWTRRQVHEFLMDKWQLANVHSEYGMTELLSQAYSLGGGMFNASDTMKVLIRDINDPLEVKKTGSGCLNIIDLANINSCSFIAAEDIGNMHADGRFEVLGRLDHAALRGCSLMVVL
ncbi:acyl transferase [Polluticoccus soli]|uniref:LuxE/PaaK family acyltransferase n=1 Tax=Polluticoccus soli TaxID=3034150 RepID=UPI0023E1BEA0|nr:acyl transferase [Flavipsychrobacter sp. JY13-12]